MADRKWKVKETYGNTKPLEKTHWVRIKDEGRPPSVWFQNKEQEVLSHSEDYSWILTRSSEGYEHVMHIHSSEELFGFMYGHAIEPQAVGTWAAEGENI